MKILFVCTGNTCRSPMAQGLYNSLAPEGDTAISAGIYASEAEHASKGAVLAMEKRGIDITDHRARLINQELIEQADLILTMTGMHKQLLNRLFKIDENRLFTLLEYANGVDTDIADPFGGSLEVYEGVAEQIEAAIKAIIKKEE